MDPALEALLPDSIDGLPLAKESHTADQIYEQPDPRLVNLGKEPADLTIAFAFHMRDRLISIWVERLDGVSGAELLAATLEGMGGAPVSQASLGGREVTLVPDGRGLTTWYYATDDLLFLMQATGEGTVAGGEETVARILTGLP